MATLLKVSTFAVVLSVATQRSPKEMCHCVVLCQCVVATSPKSKTRTLPHYGGRVRLQVGYQRDSSLSFCEALRDNPKEGYDGDYSSISCVRELASMPLLRFLFQCSILWEFQATWTWSRGHLK